jgi:LEA14-like dessication related protein
MNAGTKSAAAVAAMMWLAACASMPGHDPLQVTVAGIEPMQSEGMEMRMMVKLRVQNPNDAPVDFNGVAVKLDVLGKSLASGVSDQAGSVPRFGETVVSVPVTISMVTVARHAVGMMSGGKALEKITYSLSGKLNGTSMFSTHRFAATGDFELPKPGSSPGTDTL